MTLINNIFKKYLLKIWAEGATLNNTRLKELIEPSEKAKILDIGCESGKLIIERVKNIKNPEIFGVDIRQEAIISSRKLGIKAVKSDVEKKLPYKSDFFDLISANQIIEHIVNVENFIKEMHRVLKPKGYLLLSTENLSSWHNIFALTLGWQAFSQTYFKIKNIGNPLRLLVWSDIDSCYTHIRIFTPKGIRELLEVYSFKIENFYGAGYYPFPTYISKQLSKIDPVHAAFIGVKARKIN